MLIYGAGVIGCEYACIFGAMGTNVTVADSKPRILEYLDSEVGTELQNSMEEMGIKFILNVNLDKVEINGPSVRSNLSQQELETDVLYYAAGREANSKFLGLEKIGVKTNNKKSIVVNQNFQTNISNIYAAGDVIGHPALAATASVQGRHVSCHAFGHSIGSFPKVYPIGVYTIPELSMVGKTEETLKKNLGTMKLEELIIMRLQEAISEAIAMVC